MARTVGIDLGTSTSVMCVLENGRPRIIANAEGAACTPSVVSFTDDGRVLVGRQAVDRAVLSPDRTVASVRRHLGSEWRFTDQGRTFSAPKIAACVLMKLKRDAEVQLGEEVRDVVISVPAHFGAAERRATAEACTLAGLRALRIVGETGLAGLAYAVHADPRDEKTLVLDLGAGTFSVAVLEIGAGVAEVRAVASDNNLGGDDWDQRIAEHLVRKFRANTGIDLGTDSPALQRLRTASERAKVELSSLSSTTVELPFITTDSRGDQLFLSETLNRAEFLELTADLLDRCRVPITEVLTEAGITLRDIDRIVPIGGASRMPAFAALVTELSAGRDPYRGMHPDETVAIGAAVLIAILDGTIRNQLLLDILPRGLGIATRGGGFAEILMDNTTIPTKTSVFVTTVADGQTSVSIDIFEAERGRAASNQPIGVLHLGGLTPAPRGTPRIEIITDIDTNGEIVVTARDPGSGVEQSLTVGGGEHPSAIPNPCSPPAEIELHPDQDTGTSREKQPGAATPQASNLPPRQQPSDLIITAAANHQLGQHLSTHPHRWHGGSPVWIYGIPIAVAAGIVIASGVTNGVSGALAVMALFAAVVVFAKAKRLITAPRHTVARAKYVGSKTTGTGFKDAKLSLFEHGVVILGRAETSVFRWDTVTVLQDIVRTSHRMYGTETGVSMTYRYQLTDPGGNNYLVTGDFTDAAQWGPAIQDRVTAAQLPGALAAADAGQTLTFGSIMVNRNAVTAHGQSVPWSDIQELRVQKGFISIRVAGQWLSLTKVTVSAIPNVFVFLEIAERLRVSATA
ncbi:MAG: hypothetical protein JWN03_7092 [Nocardia sp.]|uniref:DUF6585 family protein n=1 Tax=Nocardia sp. TaxID=1821 RepID=UPI00260AB480|nr:DUF6585 family protein [Nocardia sp.]MCU1646817.1 hypothetical protein [Nocardia sp.]